MRVPAPVSGEESSGTPNGNGDPGVELDRSVPRLVLTWLEILVLSLFVLSVQVLILFLLYAFQKD